ncbi:hypothetical protein HK405_007676, partial [Cladochytrium tenue]
MGAGPAVRDSASAADAATANSTAPHSSSASSSSSTLRRSHTVRGRLQSSAAVVGTAVTGPMTGFAAIPRSSSDQHLALADGGDLDDPAAESVHSESEMGLRRRPSLLLSRKNTSRSERAASSSSGSVVGGSSSMPSRGGISLATVPDALGHFNHHHHGHQHHHHPPPTAGFKAFLRSVMAPRSASAASIGHTTASTLSLRRSDDFPLADHSAASALPLRPSMSGIRSVSPTGGRPASAAARSSAMTAAVSASLPSRRPSNADLAVAAAATTLSRRGSSPGLAAALYHHVPSPASSVSFALPSVTRAASEVGFASSMQPTTGTSISRSFGAFPATPRHFVSRVDSPLPPLPGDAVDGAITSHRSAESTSVGFLQRLPDKDNSALLTPLASPQHTPGADGGGVIPLRMSPTLLAVVAADASTPRPVSVASVSTSSSDDHGFGTINRRFESTVEHVQSVFDKIKAAQRAKLNQATAAAAASSASVVSGAGSWTTALSDPRPAAQPLSPLQPPARSHSQSQKPVDHVTPPSVMRNVAFADLVPENSPRSPRARIVEFMHPVDLSTSQLHSPGSNALSSRRSSLEVHVAVANDGLRVPTAKKDGTKRDIHLRFEDTPVVVAAIAQPDRATVQPSSSWKDIFAFGKRARGGSLNGANPATAAASAAAANRTQTPPATPVAKPAATPDLAPEYPPRLFTWGRWRRGRSARLEHSPPMLAAALSHSGRPASALDRPIPAVAGLASPLADLPAKPPMPARLSVLQRDDSASVAAAAASGSPKRSSTFSIVVSSPNSKDALHDSRRRASRGLRGSFVVGGGGLMSPRSTPQSPAPLDLHGTSPAPSQAGRRVPLKSAMKQQLTAFSPSPRDLVSSPEALSAVSSPPLPPPATPSPPASRPPSSARARPPAPIVTTPPATPPTTPPTAAAAVRGVVAAAFAARPLAAAGSVDASAAAVAQGVDDDDALTGAAVVAEAAAGKLSASRGLAFAVIAVPVPVAGDRGSSVKDEEDEDGDSEDEDDDDYETGSDLGSDLGSQAASDFVTAGNTRRWLVRPSSALSWSGPIAPAATAASADFAAFAPGGGGRSIGGGSSPGPVLYPTGTLASMRSVRPLGATTGGVVGGAGATFVRRSVDAPVAPRPASSASSVSSSSSSAAAASYVAATVATQVTATTSSRVPTAGPVAAALPPPRSAIASPESDDSSITVRPSTFAAAAGGGGFVSPAPSSAAPSTVVAAASAVASPATSPASPPPRLLPPPTPPLRTTSAAHGPQHASARGPPPSPTPSPPSTPAAHAVETMAVRVPASPGSPQQALAAAASLSLAALAALTPSPSVRTVMHNDDGGEAPAPSS